MMTPQRDLPPPARERLLRDPEPVGRRHRALPAPSRLQGARHHELRLRLLARLARHRLGRAPRRHARAHRRDRRRDRPAGERGFRIRLRARAGGRSPRTSASASRPGSRACRSRIRPATGRSRSTISRSPWSASAAARGDRRDRIRRASDRPRRVLPRRPPGSAAGVDPPARGLRAGPAPTCSMRRARARARTSARSWRPSRRSPSTCSWAHRTHGRRPAGIGVRRISVGSALSRAAWGGFMRAAEEIAGRPLRRLRRQRFPSPTSTASSGTTSRTDPMDAPPCPEGRSRAATRRASLSIPSGTGRRRAGPGAEALPLPVDASAQAADRAWPGPLLRTDPPLISRSIRTSAGRREDDVHAGSHARRHRDRQHPSARASREPAARPSCISRPGTPSRTSAIAARVEMQRPQRALDARRRTAGLHLRGRVRQHRSQGPQPRHGVVRHARIPSGRRAGGISSPSPDIRRGRLPDRLSASVMTRPSAEGGQDAPERQDRSRHRRRTGDRPRHRGSLPARGRARRRDGSRREKLEGLDGAEQRPLDVLSTGRSPRSPARPELGGHPRQRGGLRAPRHRAGMLRRGLGISRSTST